MTLNLIDALLAAVLVLGAWGGWRQGFALAAAQFVALMLGAAVAFTSYAQVAVWMAVRWPALDVWAAPLAFVLLFVMTQLITGALLARAVRSLPRATHTHGLNRVLGLAPGVANGMIHATLLSLVLLAAPLPEPVAGPTRDSVLTRRLAAPAEWLESRLTPILEPAVRRSLRTLTVRPDSRASVPLPFRVASARVRPDLEAAMLAMVNEERSRQGLPPVKPDPELSQVARAHSRDMFARGYFSHYSPEGRDLGDRLREHRIGFVLAGENLALARDLEMAHAGLMDSPGHRANILRPHFGRLGVGVLDGGRHGLMVTQNYRN